MYGTFITIVIISQGIGTAVQQPHQQIPLQVIRWGVGWSRVSMVQDLCGLQGDERWCGGVGGGFG